MGQKVKYTFSKLPIEQFIWQIASHKEHCFSRSEQTLIFTEVF